MMNEVRNQIAMNAYYEGKIDVSTLGQLAGDCYSDKIINTALERGWISIDVAKQLMTNN